MLYDSSWLSIYTELACLSQGTGCYWAVSEMEARFWNELENEMGGCRRMDIWQLPSLVSREGVSSFVLFLRGAGEHY